jgi:lysophospholipase L1-like esterase
MQVSSTFMNIIFLGDSLIEYFDWQERFPEHRIANLGIAGESVEGLLSRVVKIKDSFPEADVIFIMSGINNVAMGDVDFFNFYNVILERLSSSYPHAKIHVHSLLPTAVSFISGESVLKVNDSLKELALNHGAEYIDIHKRFIDTRGKTIKEYLMDDGVHISGTGYDVWSRVIEGIVNAQGA